MDVIDATGPSLSASEPENAPKAMLVTSEVRHTLERVWSSDISGVKLCNQTC